MIRDVDETDAGNLPEGKKVSINSDLKSKVRSDKHDDVRIKLFETVVTSAVVALRAFIVLLAGVVIVYLALLVNNSKDVPNNFWHIPTLVSLITVSILISLLKFTSSFGSFISDDSKGKQESIDSLPDHESAKSSEHWLIEVIKEFKDDMLGFFKK